jgi:hypothetical protein
MNSETLLDLDENEELPSNLIRVNPRGNIHQ